MIKPTGVLEHSLQKFAAKKKLEDMYRAGSPFTPEESTKEAIARRRQDTLGNYPLFDRTYFTPDMYAGSYAPSSNFHYAVADACDATGKEAYIEIGPHEHAKSATGYKKIIQLILQGGKHYIVIASQTLDQPKDVIDSIRWQLKNNQRILHDFPDIDFIKDEAGHIHVRTDDNTVGTVLKAASEGRSLRGKTTGLFQRPDLIWIEDLENTQSSFTKEALRKRYSKLDEMQSALSTGGCLVWTANNFDERCLANQMLTDFEKGDLLPVWHVRKWQAWGVQPFDKRKHKKPAPLWPERFPATSEEELKRMLGVASVAVWKGSFQGEPVKDEGHFFEREYEAFWDNLPVEIDGKKQELFAVVYVDPNLSKYGMGDRTCMGALIWEPSTNLIYEFVFHYQSYSNPNVLLTDMARGIKQLKALGIQLMAVGFDGNVTQESTWSAFVANYMTMEQVLLPPIRYCKYNVENIAKNAALVWTENRVRRQTHWPSTEEADRFERDFYAFEGKKKSGGKDDAPDWFCCGMQLLHDCGLAIPEPDYPDPFSFGSSSGSPSRYGARGHIGRI